MAHAGRYGTSADMWSLGVVLYILLSGSFPFDEDNLFDQITHAHYSVGGPEWAHVSEGAKHLVRSLMRLKPEERMPVTQALQHPWLQSSRDFDLMELNRAEDRWGSGLSMAAPPPPPPDDDEGEEGGDEEEGEGE